MEMTDIMGSHGNDQYHSFPVGTKISTMANIPLPLSQSVNGMA